VWDAIAATSIEGVYGHQIVDKMQEHSVCSSVLSGWYLVFQLKTEEIQMASVQKTTDSSSLAEVVDRILDKGIVIDIWAKVSLVGIELLSVEARIVIASVETYLKYAEAIGLTATAAAPA